MLSAAGLDWQEAAPRRDAAQFVAEVSAARVKDILNGYTTGRLILAACFIAEIGTEPTQLERQQASASTEKRAKFHFDAL